MNGKTGLLTRDVPASCIDYNMHRQCVRHHKRLPVLSTTFYVVQYNVLYDSKSEFRYYLAGSVGRWLFSFGLE